MIREYLAVNHRPPTILGIATHFGRATPTIHEHLQKLVRAGFLQVKGSAGCARRYIPAVSCPTCGEPLS